MALESESCFWFLLYTFGGRALGNIFSSAALSAFTVIVILSNVMHYNVKWGWGEFEQALPQTDILSSEGICSNNL